MIRISLRRSARFALLAALLAGSLPALGQGGLPPSPDYRGEIRRGADGRLTVVQEEAPVAENPVAEVPQKGAPVADTRARGTIVVGAGEKISSLTEAAHLARDGDVIEIRPGNYRGQPAIWTQNNLIIRGVGERPVMIADGKNAEGKGIWVVRGGNVRIENVEFRGARVADYNGAGIRFEKGHLKIHRCRFIDNEMGILTGNSAEQTLEVTDSEFGDAPRDAKDWHHLLYVGAIGKFVLRGSRFYNGYLGHLVKSRARESYVLYNMLADGKDGKSSYELEFPNGGLAFVIGNVIEQSAGTDNSNIVGFGVEGQRWSDNAVYLSHNTLINDNHAGTFLAVSAEKFAAGVEVWAINNLTVGKGNFFPPALGRFEGNQSVARTDLIEIGGLPARPANQSPLRGSVRLPGNAHGTELLPNAEFSYPVGTRPLRVSNALTPGAFQ